MRSVVYSCMQTEICMESLMKQVRMSTDTSGEMVLQVWNVRGIFTESIRMNSLVQDGLREDRENLKMHVNMMLLECFWEVMRMWGIGFFTEGSSMTQKQNNIISVQGIIIRFLDGSCRRIPIEEMG